MVNIYNLICILGKKTKMKKVNFLLILSLGVLTLSSCGSDNSAENVNNENEKSCLYSYNDGSSTFEWTAFKTNQKIGVSGTFNELTVNSEESNSEKSFIESLSFSMNTMTVESNNEERNGKIANLFFKTINTPEITGEIISIDGEGNAKVAINMNSKTNEIEAKYTLVDGLFSLNATIDVALWDGLNGIKTLNDVCKDLHTGTDGVSKLWSEVDVKFVTKIKSTCN